MLLIFNGSYASSDGHPSTAAGMPSASNHFRYSDYPVVIAEKLPSEFRFEHLGSLHLLVVCFIGHGLAAVSSWLRHWVRQGSSGRSVSDYAVPATWNSGSPFKMWTILCWIISSASFLSGDRRCHPSVSPMVCFNDCAMRA